MLEKYGYNENEIYMINIPYSFTKYPRAWRNYVLGNQEVIYINLDIIIWNYRAKLI